MQDDMEISNQKAPFSIVSWKSWAVTDVGKQRLRNEDAVLNNPERGVWAIADGMGGHKAGDVASQLVIESLANLRYSKNLEKNIAKVANCLQTVNTQLRAFAEQSESSHFIGSTVIILMAKQQRYAVLWAGDSRLYRLRNQQLLQITEDHCPEYVFESDKHSLKTDNELTRAVGADEFLDLDGEMSDVCAGDLFLLCSDGLNKELTQHEIEGVLLTHEPENVVLKLLELALQRGARDNISIVLAMPCQTR